MAEPDELATAREMLEFVDQHSVVEPVKGQDSIEGRNSRSYNAVFRAVPNSTAGVIVLNIQDDNYYVIQSGPSDEKVPFLALAAAYRRAATFVENMRLVEHL